MSDIFTEQDIINDFERFKKGEIYWNQIRGFNDEHKYWIIHNTPNSSFLTHAELMTDEMLKECILRGYDNFFRHSLFNQENEELKRIIERIKSLNITEDEWLEGIANHIPNKGYSFLFNSFMDMVLNCTELSFNLAYAIFYKSPLMILNEEMQSLLFKSEKKFEISNYLIHQTIENGLQICLPQNTPISEETWKYIEENYDKAFMIKNEIFLRDDVPISIRRKEIEDSRYINRNMKENMTVDDVLYWYDLYAKELNGVEDYMKDFSCNWINVVSKNPEIFKYVPRQTVKICEAAIKAEPKNIQYVKKPSEKLKNLAVSLNPDCKKYVELTEKTPESYLANYYLVSFTEDLCDEGYLHCHMVVEGKDMKKFMNKTFTVSFGNLYDDEKRRVSECASIKELTKEEYQVLKKLHLESDMSGYFNFDIDDEEEEY